jgi:flagellar hook assembly protein FlgD
MAIKMGDSFTWLTVSPYRGNVSALDSYNDSIAVKVGAFGVYDGFSIEDELLVESGEISISILIAVGVEVSVDDPKITPIEFALHQNYPNPFNPETNIQFDVAEQSHVSVNVFNLVGQKVATLVNRAMDAGIYTIKWTGLNDRGSALPSGMYFYEMKTSNYHSIKKLVLVK